MIYDVLQTFGELTDEAQNNRKYAKWKAAYIHNCLKNGETPIPGPIAMQNTEDAGVEGGESDEQSSSQGPTSPPDANFQLPNLQQVAAKLPSPPVDPEIPPGGFQAYNPSHDQTLYESKPAANNINLTPDQITKAQKYCKWAASALTYDDIKTAVENLQKGLRLLQTGQDS